MKTFRKYNKHLLVFVTVGLMIAFLLPTTLDRMFQPDPGKVTIGTAFGQRINQRDRRIVHSETQLLDTLARFVSGTKDATETFNWRSFVMFSRDPVLDYLLLIREAQHMGLRVWPQHVDHMLTEWQVPAVLVNRVIESTGVSLEMFRQAVADYILVREAFSLSAASVTVSEPELKSMFILTNERMNLAMLRLDPAKLVDQIGEPTGSQLAAHFGKHQERFRFPDRIVVEYLEADIPIIKKTIKITDRRARQYWQDHRSEFTVTTTTAATTTSSTTTAPTSQATTTVELDFEQARDAAIDKLKTRRAREKAAAAIAEARTRSRRLWRSGKADDQLNVKRTAANSANYRELARELTNKYKISIRYHCSSLVSMNEAAELTGIGGASIINNRKPVQFNHYAFRVPPFASPPRADRTSEVLFLQHYEDSGMLRKGSENEVTGYYVFRVIDAQPSRLPNALAEVNSQATDDWKMDQAYTRAQKLADTLKQAADKTKLADLTASNDAQIKEALESFEITEPLTTTLARRMVSPWAGQMMGPYLPQVEMDSLKFADLCFEKFWRQPTTQPDGTFTSGIIADDTARDLYVVQLLEKLPANTADYKQIKPWLTRIALSSKQQQFYQLWFSPQNIRQRTQYKPELADPDE